MLFLLLARGARGGAVADHEGDTGEAGSLALGEQGAGLAVAEPLVAFEDEAALGLAGVGLAQGAL
jgi:hypothetical protein